MQESELRKEGRKGRKEGIIALETASVGVKS